MGRALWQGNVLQIGDEDGGLIFERLKEGAVHVYWEHPDYSEKYEPIIKQNIICLTHREMEYVRDFMGRHNKYEATDPEEEKREG